MKATLSFAKEKYKEFNQKIFDSRLPDVPVLISNASSFLGILRFERKRSIFGKTVCYNFRIFISSRFDLPQEEIEDTIIHEMIHLYIHCNGMKDTSTHGRIFREMMRSINAKHHRNITISHRSSKETLDSDCHLKPHYICESVWNDGKRYITCVARTRIFEINEAFVSHRDCIVVRWWFSTDSFFNRYPNAQTAKLYHISENDYCEKVANATECVCDGKVFQPRTSTR